MRMGADFCHVIVHSSETLECRQILQRRYYLANSLHAAPSAEACPNPQLYPYYHSRCKACLLSLFSFLFSQPSFEPGTDPAAGSNSQAIDGKSIVETCEAATREPPEYGRNLGDESVPSKQNASEEAPGTGRSHYPTHKQVRTRPSREKQSAGEYQQQNREQQVTTKSLHCKGARDKPYAQLNSSYLICPTRLPGSSI